MAKEQSFDVVSQVDMQEVDNAVQQAAKEVAQRYDLKDSGSRIVLDKQAATITVTSPADFVARQVIDVLATKLVKRGVDLKALEWGEPQTAAGSTVRVTATIVNGIAADLSRRINKDIREQKFKVRVQVEGDKLRVFGQKRDELQAVIAFLKERDYGIPLQYTNYR
ncbi:MAG TPA: YajQ family cyclic di-GMP-binding protein [Coriobacteriia bacterium]|nr:YajQ family cyclic di-GMP-binding protein [Coriobacteriia bacterium]